MGWINIGDKELPHVGHQLTSCSLLNSYVLININDNNNNNNIIIIVTITTTIIITNIIIIITIIIIIFIQIFS